MASRNPAVNSRGRSRATKIQAPFFDDDDRGPRLLAVGHETFLKVAVPARRGLMSQHHHHEQEQQPSPRRHRREPGRNGEEFGFKQHPDRRPALKNESTEKTARMATGLRESDQPFQPPDTNQQQREDVKTVRS